MISLLLAWSCAPDGAAEGARDAAPIADDQAGSAAGDGAGDGSDADPQGGATGEEARPGIPGVPDVPDLAADVGGSGDPPDDELMGVVLSPPLAAPTFSVINQHGEVRVDADLVGEPTALWFFRDTASS